MAHAERVDQAHPRVRRVLLVAENSASVADRWADALLRLRVDRDALANALGAR